MRIFVLIFIIFNIKAQLFGQPILLDQQMVVNNPDTSQNIIQSLLDKASSGDTVYIPSGKYETYEALYIDKDITIIGIGNVEIYSQNPNDDVINITNCNARLFNIIAKHDKKVISEIYLTDFSDNVIWIDGGKEIYIENCDLKGCGAGICGSWDKLTLKNNYIHHNLRCGIFNKENEINDSINSENISFINNRIEYNGVITEKQIEEKYALIDEIGNFPINEISTETETTWFYYDRDSIVALLVKTDDNYYYKKSELKDALFVGVCYTLSSSFYNDTIWVGCQNSNGYEPSSYLSYKNNKLIHLYDTLTDANWDIKERAKQAYKNNRPIEYLQSFEGAQYYDQFFPREGEIALFLADSLCSEYVKQNEYLKAALLMDSLETIFYFTTSPRVISNCYQVWEKAAYYYLKAGMNDACIRLCKILEAEKSDSANLFLYYGDALFNINSIAEASDKYKEYVKLSKGKAIPKRVKARTNNQ